MKGFLSKIFRRKNVVADPDFERLNGTEIKVGHGDSLEVLGVIFCNATAESLRLKLYVDRGLIVVSKLEADGEQ